MKIDRQKVYAKYNGCCAYCGNEIEYKEMQVDHLVSKHEAMSRNIITGDWIHPDMDTLENLMPSCRRCNHYKRAETLKNYRERIVSVMEKVKRDYLFNVAVDYGLITPEYKEWDGLFYFETLIQ